MTIRNRRGFITIDYLFSFILIGAFSFIIFALSLTLTMAELVQYITFASARNFLAAHESPIEQQRMAFEKFQELSQSETLSPLLNSGWFELRQPTISSNVPEEVPQMADLKNSMDYRPDRSLFHGTLVYFVGHVLEFNVPFYGSTVNDELRGGEDFGTYIASYLGREVTQQECVNFQRLRWEKIRQLPVNGATAYSAADGDNSYVGFTDNGC